MCQCQCTVKNAVCCRRRLSRTVSLTVKLALTQWSCSKAPVSLLPPSQVGGPATMQTQHVQDFIADVTRLNLPIDFISTHLYPRSFCLVTCTARPWPSHKLIHCIAHAVTPTARRRLKAATRTALHRCIHPSSFSPSCCCGGASTLLSLSLSCCCGSAHATLRAPGLLQTLLQAQSYVLPTGLPFFITECTCHPLQWAQRRQQMWRLSIYFVDQCG